MPEDRGTLKDDSRGAVPWFRKSFGTYYQDLYGHRDDREAMDAVELLVRHLPIAAGPSGSLPVLDIACGAGRHLRAMEERGLATLGLDLSWYLLKNATKQFRGRLVRSDMRRLPFRTGSFGAALSMFTSLGYFNDLEDNRLVLAEAARVVAAGGGIAVDYFNVRTTLESLVPESVRTVGRYEAREKRLVTDGSKGFRRIIKTVDILDEGKTLETLHEEVLLLDPGTVTGLLTGAGFNVVEQFGDYDGSPFQEDRSPRFLVLARKGRS